MCLTWGEVPAARVGLTEEKEKALTEKKWVSAGQALLIRQTTDTEVRNVNCARAQARDVGKDILSGRLGNGSTHNSSQ